MVLVASTSVQAQTATDKAAAEALFNDGRKLVSSGDFAQACAKFEASQTLDPGVGTSLNLADCYEKAGRTASAWAQFRDTMSAARKAGSLERERIARKRAEQLEPKLSYLTILPAQAQTVAVTRDGVALDAAVLGTAIPIDPGTHVVAASAAGKRSWSTEVSVGAAADRLSVSVPVLADEPAPAPPPPAVIAQEVAASQPAAPAAVSGSDDAQSTRATRRILAIAAAGVGVAGLAAGSVFGLMAASSWQDAKADCHPYPYCGDNGVRLAKDAASNGTVSTIAFVIGGVGVAASAVLWFTAPKSTEEHPTAFYVGPGSIHVHGRF
jgi:hypothetical protein